MWWRTALWLNTAKTLKSIKIDRRPNQDSDSL